MHAGEPRGRSCWAGYRERSVILPSDWRICESLLTTARRLPIRDDCLVSFRRNPPEGCDVCAAGYARQERRGVCDMPAVSGAEIRVRTGAPLWALRRSAGRSDPAAVVPRAAAPEKERTRVQSVGTICAAAGEATGNPVPAGVVDADADASRETPTGLRGEMGIGTWRFCAEAKRAS
jgi:hypothetical protein